jgi:hypothetical protein
MSMPTDLENRLTAALAARAEEVRPEHLTPGLAPVVALRRRTPLIVLAAAACVLLVVMLSFWLPDDDRRVVPAPEPSDPEIVIPPDVGRDWDRAKASTPAELDLDGDGTREKVRFLAEPSEEYDGRVRLQTTLSSDGSSAFGVIDVGTTIGLSALDPIDADADGDQELVLWYDEEPMRTVPVVLDLRDGLLVQAPPSEPDLLVMGQTTASEGGEFYDLVHTSDYWIEDGTLFSARSRGTFAAGNMTLFAPEEYTMDAWAWRLTDDGVLEPEPASTTCVTHVPEGRRPCVEGEQDVLPQLAPVADERVEVGDEFSLDTGYRFDVRVEPEEGADGAVVVEGEDGRAIRTPVHLGSELRVFTTQPTGIFYDGASLLVASEDGDEPSGMQVLVQDGDALVTLEPVGGMPFGTGYTDDQRAFRTWLTDNGEVFTAVADTDDESGPWQVWSWVMSGDRSMAAVPRATVCFADPSDPATGQRC